MAYDADDLATDSDSDKADNGYPLPDVTALPAAAIWSSGDTVLDRALRRIAAGFDDRTPVAAFGNFAPDPPPH
jgi:FXSXX-COOH protein